MAMMDLASAISRANAVAAGEADDGSTIRLADVDDLGRISRLTGDSIHPETVAEIWALAAQSTTPLMVVELDGAVVSTMAVFTGSLDVGGTRLRFCQPEFVSTKPGMRNRGFVARLMAVLHDSALVAGIPISLLSGLEYFYRQFGYSYAILEHGRHILTETPSSVDEAWSCRRATADDIVAMDALQDSVQRHVDVTVSSTGDRWRWLMALDHYQLVVAEKHDRIEAMARVYVDEDGIELSETAARSVPAADAVLSHVRSDGDGRRITVPDRPGGGSRFLDRRSEIVVERDAFYVRPSSSDLLIEAMVPAFNDRLARSSFASWTGPLPISMYTSGLELSINDGVISRITPFNPESAPPRGDEPAVPPDLLADLVFSDLGAAGLEQRHPDVQLGTRRRIMSTLFPPVTADFLLY